MTITTDTPTGHGRHVLYEARTAAQVLAGDLPGPASGVFFRQAERLLCRAHLTAEHLAGVGDEAGVVLWGFTDCDECWVDVERAGDEQLDVLLEDRARGGVA